MPEPVRLPRASYDAMIAAGIFGKDDKIELLDGQLLTRVRETPQHAWMNMMLLRRLFELLPNSGVSIFPRSPIALSDYSEPEPDFAIVRGEIGDLQDHPAPADIFFLIEVADSSLRFDRESKIPLYAACDIQECWLVDVIAREVTVFTKPEGTGYGQSTTYRAGDTIPLAQFPGVSLAISELGW